MAYRLKHRESVPEGVKRIAREEIRSAVQYLRGKGGVSRDEAVHEARKSIKKARALLRLVRPELGDFYASESARLRDAGRKLSQLRDLGALIATFDELKKWRAKALGNVSLTAIRRALAIHKKRVEAEMGIQDLMHGLAADIGPTLQSVQRWPLKTDGFAALEPGLEKTYRSGKKAFGTLKKHASREQPHVWRKRVKDHWYHVRLLESLWTDVMKGYEQTLKGLEDALGEDLNLAILRDHILSASGPQGEGRRVDRVVKAVDESRKELRKRALAIGRRVDVEKPRQFTRQMEQHLGRVAREPHLKLNSADWRRPVNARRLRFPVSSERLSNPRRKLRKRRGVAPESVRAESPRGAPSRLRSSRWQVQRSVRAPLTSDAFCQLSRARRWLRGRRRSPGL
jgi:CHAD domain-containing protein